MSNTVIDVDSTASEKVHPWPYLASIFEIISVKDKSAHVKCLLCQPKQKVLSSALNSPSNLQKHVEVSFFFILQTFVCFVYPILTINIKIFIYSLFIFYLLQRVHPSELKTYKSLTAGMRSSTKRLRGPNQSSDIEQPCMKQLKIGENR